MQANTKSQDPQNTSRIPTINDSFDAVHAYARVLLLGRENARDLFVIATIEHPGDDLSARGAGAVLRESAIGPISPKVHVAFGRINGAFICADLFNRDEYLLTLNQKIARASLGDKPIDDLVAALRRRDVPHALIAMQCRSEMELREIQLVDEWADGPSIH
jgi:hypothetical protein